MTYDSENNRSAPADWNDSADDTGATDADVDADANADVDADGWDNQPNFAAGASRSPGLLAWVAGGVVLALIVLALIWGISGIGRVEPTATPTPTLVTVFQATATPTMLAGAVITPTADLSFTATPTPAPIPATQIRMGGRVRVVNANPEGISVRFGAGQGNARMTTLYDGVELTVMEPPAGYTDPYPTIADGFTWWRIRMDDGTVGWMASAWLQPIN